MKVVISDYVWPNIEIEKIFFKSKNIDLVVSNNKSDLKKQIVDADGLLFCFESIDEDILRSGKNLKAEFSDSRYKYGTVGMARSMNPDSGDSQFFICFDGCGHLTGQYTVWGQVETGMEVVEKIEIGEPPSNPDQIIEAFVGKKKTK